MPRVTTACLSPPPRRAHAPALLRAEARARGSKGGPSSRIDLPTATPRACSLSLSGLTTRLGASSGHLAGADGGDVMSCSVVVCVPPWAFGCCASHACCVRWDRRACARAPPKRRLSGSPQRVGPVHGLHGVEYTRITKTVQRAELQPHFYERGCSSPHALMHPRARKGNSASGLGG
jgi:hypothetical protein